MKKKREKKKGKKGGILLCALTIICLPSLQAFINGGRENLGERKGEESTLGPHPL